MKQDKNMNKTERELFEEEMAKWPEELERRAEEIRKRSQKLNEGTTPQFNSVEELDKYFEARSWDEVFQRLINNADK